MKNLWEVWPSALNPIECSNIVERCINIQPLEATIGFNDDNTKNIEYRSSTIRWLDVDNQHKDIADMMMWFTTKSNRNNFGFDITRMNEIQFTTYESSNYGKYDWHYDTHWENDKPFDRKLTAVIQLSDESSYKGGDFEFFGMQSPDDSFKKMGSIIVFPSFFYHRVKPVLEGIRHSLVTWVEGPKFR